MKQPSPDTSGSNHDFCNGIWGVGDGGVDALFARMRGAARTTEELRNFWKERSAIEEDYANRLAKLAKMQIGKDEIGVDVLFARMRNATRITEELRNFWKERSAIEEEYAKRLAKLARMLIREDEIGELRNSIDTLRLETDKQAGFHAQLAQQIRTDLEIPVYQAMIEEAHKVKQTREQHAREAREKYKLDCVSINSYTVQSTLVQGNDLEKDHLKPELAEQTAQVNEDDYVQKTKVSKLTMQEWEQNWKAFCDTCQDLEEERMEFMKDNMWTYANAMSMVCVSDDESCEQRVNRAATGSPTGTYTDDGRPILFHVEALYDYVATSDAEFDFYAGDIIAVTDTPQDGWWNGELTNFTRREAGDTCSRKTLCASSELL
ncbi:hypothetical protein OG21DRAFT_1481898 [Imleria badia]|nr:hypothetical protein OG21DRAFT_1481898 [Imleria badia]